MSTVKKIVKNIAYKVPVLKEKLGAAKVLSEENKKLVQTQESLIQERDHLINALSDYRNKTKEEMMKIAFERPFDIALETFTRCNSRCVFCAYRKVRRKKELMPMDLFEKICSEYVEMGGGALGFAPLLADPLLDPYLLDRIRRARKWHPAIRMYIFTNAIQFSRYSDEKILLILDSIEGMNISLSMLSREDYKKMFQVDKYDAVMNTLRRINRLSKEVEFAPDIYLHARTSRQKETLESETFKRLVDMGFLCGDVSDIFTDWGGIIKKEEMPEGTQLLSQDNRQAGIDVPCLIPMVSLTISANGDVLACGCFDADMANIVGNIGQETLHEIWHGENLKTFRESFSKKQLADICVTCAHYTSIRDTFSQPFFIGFNPREHSFWASLYHKKTYKTKIVDKTNFRYY